MLDVHEQRYENSDMFKRLGCLLTNANEVATGIKARIIGDDKCYRAPGRTLKGSYITQSLRMGLCKTVVKTKCDLRCRRMDPDE